MNSMVRGTLAVFLLAGGVVAYCIFSIAKSQDD